MNHRKMKEVAFTTNALFCNCNLCNPPKWRTATKYYLLLYRDQRSATRGPSVTMFF